MKYLLTTFLMFYALISLSQKPEYFTKYKDLANKMEEKYGIPSCVILAVGYIESGGGTSKAGRLLNNHFGIVGPCKEEISKYKSRYRYFPSVNDSFIGFCDLLASKKYYQKLKGSKDTSKWINSIASGGYAADANHWSKTVIGIIQKYCLNQFRGIINF